MGCRLWWGNYRRSSQHLDLQQHRQGLRQHQHRCAHHLHQQYLSLQQHRCKQNLQHRRKQTHSQSLQHCQCDQGLQQRRRRNRCQRRNQGRQQHC